MGFRSMRDKPFFVCGISLFLSAGYGISSKIFVGYGIRISAGYRIGRKIITGYEIQISRGNWMRSEDCSGYATLSIFTLLHGK